jgi:hypothetical protein
MPAPMKAFLVPHRYDDDVAGVRCVCVRSLLIILSCSVLASANPLILFLLFISFNVGTLDKLTYAKERLYIPAQFA